MNAVEIDGLTYTYPGAPQPTLKEISLQIEKGDFLAVVGNNGCGKSTLCKALNGLIPHFITGTMEGSVRVEGLDTRESDVGVLAQKVGYVYQDFENQIVRPTVLDDASYACLNYAFPDYLARGRTALRQCGLEGREEEYVWQLSGGQTHLLALAGAVSLQPDILILDEPIAQLDPMHADRIYEVLRDLNENHGKTILVIEHHTEYIADYCKHVMLMRDGQVRWILPTENALQRVEELEECNIFPPQVTQAAHRLRRAGRLPADILLPTTVEGGKTAFAGLHYISRERPAPAVPDGESAVSFQDVSLAYRSVKGEPHTVFDGLNLNIRKGEKVALIGSNGAGKSTLMKLMVGLLKPNSGTVSLFEEAIGDKKAEDLSRQISLVYQNPEEMFIKDSIRADIAYAMEVRNVPEWEKRTGELLERFRLTELADRDGRLMSGGQMRRASLAIGIALNPGILLLDEPTANLDIATRREILAVLEDMKDVVQTAVIATHDMQLVCQWAERIIVLCGGRVVADGPRDEIFARTDVVDQVGIRPPEIFSMGRALDPRAMCYTIDEFLSSFQGV
ncbi:ABC transporter ATP-binding protein [Pseudoflavonifractor phocaeensis]|uniref:ABC transporter ATP-binding protein n=1 Tax=Pseudoflavonifractor phocaeensis TaxID=1870988 RepID=UPI0019579DE4|nr:energy-coupling factor transporter ATPase [Pseudoflavonifractor phocaeensis]MBM6938348.1 ABC transporter ATP-binding protein [Pseudoflavonifractor phocaeensis]